MLMESGKISCKKRTSTDIPRCFTNNPVNHSKILLDNMNFVSFSELWMQTSFEMMGLDVKTP